jgi:predicted secreted protein
VWSEDVNWTSALAIYVLFWVMCGFIVMPFGMRTADEMGVEKVPGQAESAPANWRPGRVALITTALATLVFGLYYANYVYGWITADTLDFVN